jgi:hypothetical protein
MTQMQVRRRRVESSLDAERPAGRKLILQLSFEQKLFTTTFYDLESIWDRDHILGTNAA